MVNFERASSLLRKAVGFDSSAAPTTTQAARSVSDDGMYPEFCARASRDAGTFRSFRSDPGYQRILEHLTPEQGHELAALMEAGSSRFLDREILARVAENDTVGGPTTLITVLDVRISPTTLRYLKVAADIVARFDVQAVSTIAEIGVGYGGQVRVLDTLDIGRSYHMFDLAPVLDLASRYLECFVLHGSYTTGTLNQTNSLEADLVLSMYALSELPRTLQLAYYEKILKHARAGFLIMNDCWDFDRLSRDEWAQLLGAEIRAELPETGAGNYVLLWGHRR